MTSFVTINRKMFVMTITSTIICLYFCVGILVPKEQPPDAPLINFTTNFSYPLDIDMVKLVSDYRNGHIITDEVINPFPYEFIRNPSHKCKLSKEEVKVQDKVFILFMVKSAYGNRRYRDAIRQTWGREGYLRYFNIKTVFTVGVPKDRSQIERIKNESDLVKDILQVDHIDSYFNNTLKMMAEFKWVVKFCQNVKYVVFIDDDYFVSPESLVSMLEYSQNVRDTKLLYMGHKVSKSKPIRDKRNKWYVSHSEYPYDMYPDFINAGTIIMSMEFVIDAQIAMMYTKLFRLDDIFLSIVAKKLQVKAFGTKRVFNRNVMPWDTLNFEFLVTAHHYKPFDVQWLWRRHGRKKNTDIHPRPN
ncbi:beta-1,3-galactosyltransferase brn-like [Pecten maximus]|uniref:beta-1,3-galactosyltransferase brn-like n=1 Tax=Pecten maximus TaxID=6579 RepID=UPI001458096B|nr:beta-1,3-galactosyltransferase brn-like [Pecten maximus]